MSIAIDCFKAYDIRGQVPGQLNADIAYRIGNATAEFLDAKRVVLGRAMRLSSAEIADAVVRGLVEAGIEVLDIGLCGTEMVYFATAHLNAVGGIMVTASHNPADYNGLKLWHRHFPTYMNFAFRTLTPLLLPNKGLMTLKPISIWIECPIR